MAQDRFKYFRVEARELLDQLGQGALRLEQGPPEPELLPKLLRLAHTLKGAARVVRQIAIADLAHALEDALGPYRDTTAPVPHEPIEVVLGLLDAIDSHLRPLDLPATEPSAGPAREAAASAGAPAPPPGTSVEAAPRGLAGSERVRYVRADGAEIDALLTGLGEIHARVSELSGELGALDRVSDLAHLLAGRRGASHAGGTTVAAARAGAMADDLRSRLTALDRGLRDGLEQVERELRSVREAGERLRLLPVRHLFSILERTLRDAAQSLGKRAVLRTEGGEVRLDSDVLGLAQTALVQLVRNAVAHGLEPEGARAAAGKPPEGTVRVSVQRRGGRVVFACEDDGGGLDVDAVRRIAEQRSVPLGRGGEGDDPSGLFERLFDGGLSTSPHVTAVAGRGIGLDVVRAAAQQLDGTLAVRSTPGLGTTIELAIPAVRSSLTALLISVGQRTAALPLDAVRATLRLAANDVARSVDGESVEHDGRVIPFTSLARVLVDATAGAGPAPPLGAALAPGGQTALLLDDGERVAAFGVERVLGLATLVVRPLPAVVEADPIVAGAALDGAGRPRLVLDAAALITAAGARAEAPAPARRRREPILIIDDSLTTRMLEQSILETAGFEVALATSAEDGLDMARRQSFSLFLVDVEMPGMDGYTFIETVRADPSLRDIPSILVTSRSSDADLARGRAVGAQAFIVKTDFDQSVLLARIRELIA